MPAAMRKRITLLLLFCCSAVTAVAQDTLRLVFLGDIMAHQAQLQAARLPGKDSLSAQAYDFSSYFRHIQPFLEQADYAIANLECTLEALPYTGYPSFSAPATLLQAAQASGIDVFLSANNHIVDKGRRGLEQTYKTLQKVQALNTGFYPDSTDYLQHDPLMLEGKGQRIALINFTYGTNGIAIPSPWIVNKMDRASVSKSIERARQQHADWIIALPHWGLEYQLTPHSSQAEWTEFLQQQGVRIIVGTHPHVIQPLISSWDGYGRELLTWYSLGNAISNMSAPHTRIGFLVEVSLTRDALGRHIIADYQTIWLWCSRAGGYEKNYTILPIESFLGKRNEFCNPADYDRMLKEYNTLKQYFENL